MPYVPINEDRATDKLPWAFLSPWATHISSFISQRGERSRISLNLPDFRLGQQEHVKKNPINLLCKSGKFGEDQ
ncbi:MAG: hypothetical protein BA865_12435 [Desulfobacterales bacterium S5133MH4]|nr:MAG: hypothetical protein BA865_12435 [Desulfobacterales bacterium S5133MH4]